MILRRLFGEGVLEEDFLAGKGLVLVDGEEEAVGDEEVGVELNYEQDDAGVVDFESRVDPHQDEQREGVDCQRQQLVCELPVQLVGAHARVDCQEEDDYAQPQHHVLPT